MSPLAYCKNDIIEALQKAGIQEGDTAYFTTSLGMFGFPHGVQSQDDLNQLFLESIQEVMGPGGTIIVPTYSYTFGKSTRDRPAVFDPERTPAEIGPFPNFFLKRPGVLRSHDPMVSMAALGPSAKNLFQDLPSTSYGRGSLYERLLELPRTKCVSLGLGPNWTPFIHYADYLVKVPFRYDKIFYGRIRETSGNIRDVPWLYSVRANLPESWADAHPLGKEAVKAGIWSFSPLGRARVYVCDYKQYFEFALEKMKENKWFTARGPERPVIGKMKGIFQEGEDLLDHFRKEYPLIRIHKFITGTNVLDWVIPENWAPLEATLKDETGHEVLNSNQGSLMIRPGVSSFEGPCPVAELTQYFLPTEDLEKLRSPSYQVTLKTVSSMGELAVGEWAIEGKSKKTVLVCAYWGGGEGEASAAPLALSFMKTLSSIPRKMSYRLVLASGAAGYAGFLTTLSLSLSLIDVVEALHLLPSKSLINPLAPGHNPIAHQKLADLPFDNKIFTFDESAESLEDWLKRWEETCL